MKDISNTFFPLYYPKIRLGFEIRKKKPAHFKTRDFYFHWFVKVELWATLETAITALKHGCPMLKKLKSYKYCQ